MLASCCVLCRKGAYQTTADIDAFIETSALQKVRDVHMQLRNSCSWGLEHCQMCTVDKVTSTPTGGSMLRRDQRIQLFLLCEARAKDMMRFVLKFLKSRHFIFFEVSKHEY